MPTVYFSGAFCEVLLGKAFSDLGYTVVLFQGETPYDCLERGEGNLLVHMAMCGGWPIREESLRICKDKQITTVYWSIEDPNHYRISEQCRGFDYVFTTSGACVPKYIRDHKVHTSVLQLACDPAVHYHDPECTFEPKPEPHDIVLIANYYILGWLEARHIGIQNVLTPLVEAGVYDIAVYGDTYWLSHGKLPEKYYKGATNWREVRQYYSQAKIVLGINLQRDDPTMCSMRTFEALGSRSCYVTDYNRAVASMFQQGKHLYMCRTPAGTRALVDTLLANEAIRLRIARAGQDEVYASHTYMHRVKRILQVVGGGR